MELQTMEGDLPGVTAPKIMNRRERRRQLQFKSKVISLSMVHRPGSKVVCVGMPELSLSLDRMSTLHKERESLHKAKHTSRASHRGGESLHKRRHTSPTSHRGGESSESLRTPRHTSRIQVSRPDKSTNDIGSEDNSGGQIGGIRITRQRKHKLGKRGPQFTVCLSGSKGIKFS